MGTNLFWYIVILHNCIYCIYCILHIDALNKKDHKIFPVAVTYFAHITRHIAQIDFYEDHEEDVSAILRQLKSSII